MPQAPLPSSLDLWKRDTCAGRMRIWGDGMLGSAMLMSSSASESFWGCLRGE